MEVHEFLLASVKSSVTLLCSLLSQPKMVIYLHRCMSTAFLLLTLQITALKIVLEMATFWFLIASFRLCPLFALKASYYQLRLIGVCLSFSLFLLIELVY